MSLTTYQLESLMEAQLYTLSKMNGSDPDEQVREDMKSELQLEEIFKSNKLKKTPDGKTIFTIDDLARIAKNNSDYKEGQGL